MTKRKTAKQLSAHDLVQLWEQARWDELSTVGLDQIAQFDERAELALIIVAAHFHKCDKLRMKAALQQARDWGASRADVQRMLYAGLANSTGRIAVLLGRPEAAERHFLASMSSVHAGEIAERAAFVRHFHEMANFGLLPEAAKKLSNLRASAAVRNEASSSWLRILDSKIEQMHHELSLALSKGQLVPGGDTSASAEDDPKTFAEAHSVSQLQQDVWVLENSRFKKRGYFVEFGATNGVLLSNSYLLETGFGWRGLCAEPNPKYFEQLRQNRKCKVSQDCISGETGRKVRFILADEFGGFEEYAEADMHSDKRRAYEAEGAVMELETISLHDFLRKHKAPKKIDYLSIDTEGSEYEILSAFPFESWDIRLITVEHNFTPEREKIAALLEKQGYERTEAQWDDWYRKKSK